MSKEELELYRDWEPQTTIQSIDGKGKFTTYSGDRKKLSTRELQLLTLLYDGYCSVHDLQEGLIKRGFTEEKLLPHTIYTHLDALYKKLEIPEVSGDQKKIWALLLASDYCLIPSFGSLINLSTSERYRELVSVENDQ